MRKIYLSILFPLLLISCGLDEFPDDYTGDFNTELSQEASNHSLNGMFHVQSKYDAPSCSGDVTDLMHKYVYFDGSDISIYYELTYSIWIPTSTGGTIMTDDGKRYNTAKRVAYFSSIDSQDTNMQYAIKGRLFDTNIIFGGESLRFKIKAITEDKIELDLPSENGEGHHYITKVSDEQLIKSLLSSSNSTIDGIRDFYNTNANDHYLENQ